MTGLKSDPFTFAATGDAIIARRVLQYEGNDDRFDRLLSLLRDADAAVTQLEVALPDADDPVSVPPAVPDQYQSLAAFPGSAMGAPPGLLDELSGMGLDVFTAASNHAYDFGPGGIESTIAALEARGLPYAGIGRDSSAARAPAYLDTGAGRMAVLNATTGVGPGSEAGAAAPDRRGAPGVNPLHLRWRYRLPPDELDALRGIARTVGIEDVKGTWLRRGQPGWTDGDAYHFMHMAFEAADDPGIEYEPYEPDRRAILGAVAAADGEADRVVATLHAHHGPDGARNVPGTPAFLREFARDCVDAGADAFVGTGPHVLRGIELYDGAPLFYSLGNFVYQIEAVSETPADYPGDPAGMDAERASDPSVEHGDVRRWETIVPRCTFGADGALERVDLFPCALGRDRDGPRRGVPVLATGDRADATLERIAGLSEPFGTAVERDGDVGVIAP